MISLLFTLGNTISCLSRTCQTGWLRRGLDLSPPVAAGLKGPLPLRPSRPLRRKSYLRAQERSPTGPWARRKK